MNALLILGDNWHAAAPYEHALREAWNGLELSSETVKYPVVFEPRQLEGRDLLLLCSEGLLPNDRDRRWIDLPGEEAIDRFVRTGGILIGLHSGLVSFEPGGPLHRLFGGSFHGHPPECPFTVVDADGNEVATMEDEFYRYDVPPEDAAVSHWIVSPEHGREPAAWTRRIGEGRVVCLTLAHNRPNLRLPVVQSLLRGAVTD